MVEFGLKLEDNKVSEWSEYYIDYGKLKAILKKAKAAQKKYEDHAKKRPADAAKVIEAHKTGNFSAVLTTPTHSASNLQQLASHIENEIETTDDGALANERTSLLSTSNNDDNATTASSDSDAKLFAKQVAKKLPSFTTTLSNFSDKMFGSRFERTARGLLTEIDNLNKEFGDLLIKEQTRSVEFYYSKLRELEQRLQGLMETVSHSTVLKKAAADALKRMDDEEKQKQQEQQEKEQKQQEKQKQREIIKSNSIDETTPITTSSTSTITTTTTSDNNNKTLERLLDSNPMMKLSDATSSLGRTFTKGSRHAKRATQVRFEALLARFQENINMDDDFDDDVKNKNNHGSSSSSSGTSRYKSSSDMKVDDNDLSDDEAEKEEKEVAEADSIKRALIDQYRTAKLLHNFANMNYTGFVKIIKKHDKSLPSKKGEFKHILDPNNLYHEGDAVDKLAKQYERYFANWFCEGDVRAAHAQMLPKKGDGLEMDWSQLRLGYRMGMCAVLALWVGWDCIWGLVADGHSTIGGRAAFPVFRACGGILLLQWFWACSVFIWTRYRVNYIYLFDFNPRIVATPLGLCEESVDNSLVFLVLMLLYYKAGARDIPDVLPSGAYPFMLVLYTTYNLIFPFRTRLPMWRAIGKVVSAPLHPPSFFHGYVGDIFTSMVKVFQDIAWTICWVFTGSFTLSEDLDQGLSFGWSKHPYYKNILIPMICLFPLLVRFNQCLRRYIDTGDRFPHLANATKYALSQTVTLFGAFHPLYLEHKKAGVGYVNLFQIFWTFVFVSSSLYSFFWDVKMDWGLGKPEFGFLGDSLMYPKRSYYYVVICLDLVLRFMWVLTLVPPSSGARFEVPIYLATMSMMLELFRRTIWGFLRLENEHRSNAAGFRRVSFVPLHFNTGHQHKYKDNKHTKGQMVLQEVVIIALAVLGVCVSSVIAAQRANKFV